MRPMYRFEGKNVLVTGAASGIGAACVRRLLDEGAFVVAVDLRQDALESMVASLNSREQCAMISLDVTDAQQVQAAFDNAVRQRGELHGLVNSAGVRAVGSTLDIDPSVWRRVMAVNVDGTFNACRAFASVAQGRYAGKAIVNLSSTTGIRGLAQRVGYSTSKHAVTGMTRSMALEFGPLGMRVNAVAPGTVRTPFTAETFQDPARVERMRRSIPLGREGLPEEVAGPVAFLLSDDASYINGAVLSIDGGSTVGIGLPG